MGNERHADCLSGSGDTCSIWVRYLARAASWPGGINASRTVVGTSCPSSACNSSTAVLWNSDRHIVDLNNLVLAGSHLHLYAAIAISDSGEILALGMLPDGGIRTAVLTPASDYDTACEQRIQEEQRVSAPVRLTGTAAEVMKARPNHADPLQYTFIT